MSRPTARRRPTALRLTETDPTYVLTASFATSAAFATAVYLYQYSGGDDGRPWISTTAFLCSGLVSCCSAMQRHYLPLRSEARSKDDKAALRIVSKTDLLPVLYGSLNILSRICVMDRLGAERSISVLLPLEGLIRARRGGFMRANQASVLLGVALLAGFVTDCLSQNQSIRDAVLGYGWVFVAIASSNLHINAQYLTGDLSIWSGSFLLICGLINWLTFGSPPASGSVTSISSVLLFVVSLAWQPTQPLAISTALTSVWPAITSVCLLIGTNLLHRINWFQCISFAGAYLALLFSVRTSGVASSAQSAANVVNKNYQSVNHVGYYIKEIMAAKESRDIFYFLLLNLSFMVVQMLYGIWTNSLGLISDSIHMFFDCLALGVGLVAAVMSNWPASQSHPFGFAKVEIISGFANGIFLVLISVSIMIEAFERLLEPPEMKTDQLLLISTLGLCVNLVGIFAFNHGHHHHHGHSHSHDHGHSHTHDHKHDPLPNIHTPRLSKHDDSFDHVRGLRSPMPDFSDFSGFDAGSRTPLNMSAFPQTLRDVDENMLAAPSGNDKPRSISPYRSRSPIRRPGSPLKFAIESNLPDLVEGTAKQESESISTNTNCIPRGRSTISTSTPTHTHTHGHGHIHESATSLVSNDHGEHVHGREPVADSHTPTHDAEQAPYTVEHKHHSHSRTLSYDLTAGNNHSHNHTSSHGHTHAHSHGHDHSHNMEGIFLHILADTLGSGGVIVSTLLIRYFGWTGFDPLASIFIAVLIFLSVIPLLKSSFRDLLLTLQDDQEYTLREVLGEVSLISGVSGIPFIRFWVDGQQQMHGILTIRAGIDGDTDLVRQKVRQKLQDGVPNLADVVVQVDRLE